MPLARPPPPPLPWRRESDHFAVIMMSFTLAARPFLISPPVCAAARRVFYGRASPPFLNYALFFFRPKKTRENLLSTGLYQYSIWRRHASRVVSQWDVKLFKLGFYFIVWAQVALDLYREKTFWRPLWPLFCVWFTQKTIWSSIDIILGRTIKLMPIVL